LVLRSQTDERLAALTRDGHDQAFVAIAERYRRELIAHARRLAPKDRCEDIVQQAMLSAWDALRRQADVRDARAWLHRIVHNVALNVAPSSMDHEQLSETFAAAEGADTEVERRLAATEALVAVAALPAAQRRAVELTAIEGRSGREAAGLLGISEGALRQLVHRARATLRSAATALVPLPLATWAAGGTNETITARIGEICAGAGIAATVTKSAPPSL
jgi:RNA polymerase sigma factor (sigma-70 family)